MTKRELQQAAGWAALVMIITCLPYLAVAFITPPGSVFPWILFNSDDHGVYFAWIRQAHDGHLLFRNLFTTDPQRGIYLHLYFLLLGLFSRVTHLSIPFTYHLGRLFFGGLTLVLVYRLGALFTTDRFARGCIFWTTAFSGGLGWLFWADNPRHFEPVDVWQPEALTFPSLYDNGLFCFATALMLGVVICLLLAEVRGRRFAVYAGLLGLVLGNTHSYDMIHLAAAWGVYLLFRWVAARRFPTRETGLALLAAAFAAPSVGYMYWLYRTEPIFRARADTATLSPPAWLYLLGYGLLVPLAAYGLWLLLRARSGPEGRTPGAEQGPHATLSSSEAPTPTHPHTHTPTPSRSELLLPAWILAVSILVYLPVAFQRKMVMGLHFPISILAGLAISAIAQRLAARRPEGASPDRLIFAGIVAGLLIFALMPTTFRWLIRDWHLAVNRQETSTEHPVAYPEPVARAYLWYGENSGPTAAVLCYPMWGVMVPYWSGRTVYAGHWGETPRFNERMREILGGFYGRWSGADRLAYLQAGGITHVAVGPAERFLEDKAASQPGFVPVEKEPFLVPVHTETDPSNPANSITIYALR